MKHDLNAKLLGEFLKKAGDQLHGDWLLVGGTLLPAVGLDIRSTVDIDLVSLNQKDNSQTLALMELADSLALPIETINQAAMFFLRDIPYGKADLILLSKGRTAKIFRPSVALYWQLKLARMSETDLIDCQHYYHYCMGQKDSISPQRLEQIVNAAAKKISTPEKKRRALSLRDIL